MLSSSQRLTETQKGKHRCFKSNYMSCNFKFAARWCQAARPHHSSQWTNFAAVWFAGKCQGRQSHDVPRLQFLIKQTPFKLLKLHSMQLKHRSCAQEDLLLPHIVQLWSRLAPSNHIRFFVFTKSQESIRVLSSWICCPRLQLPCETAVLLECKKWII